MQNIHAWEIRIPSAMTNLNKKFGKIVGILNKMFGDFSKKVYKIFHYYRKMVSDKKGDNLRMKFKHSLTNSIKIQID